MPGKIKVHYCYVKKPSDELQGVWLFRRFSGVVPLQLIAAMKNVSAW